MAVINNTTASGTINTNPSFDDLSERMNNIATIKKQSLYYNNKETIDNYNLDDVIQLSQNANILNGTNGNIFNNDKLQLAQELIDKNPEGIAILITTIKDNDKNARQSLLDELSGSEGGDSDTKILASLIQRKESEAKENIRFFNYLQDKIYYKITALKEYLDEIDNRIVNNETNPDEKNVTDAKYRELQKRYQQLIDVAHEVKEQLATYEKQHLLQGEQLHSMMSSLRQNGIYSGYNQGTISAPKINTYEEEILLRRISDTLTMSDFPLSTDSF